MAKTDSILDKYPDYEAVIGIEVHVQLNTKTKIFCPCINTPDAQPNSNICFVCTGQPGVLPVFNKAVVESAIKAGLAINCDISLLSYFDRKHYFYPDLPKGYQITQQYQPICLNGYVPIRLEDGSIKKITLRRIHIEEDAGKNMHVKESDESFVDLNRAGTPLLEIVSEPDISSAYEARTYLKTLRSIVQYLGIGSGNMQEGAFRADTNISVRKKGVTELGTKCELKNINSFKYIADATEHEIERQIEMCENGQTIKQETRLWDTKNKITVTMRSKEEAADYRYFRDPDLTGVEITDHTLNTIRAAMPELPSQKFERYVKDFGLSEYEADILVEEIDLARYFETAYALCPNKQIVNWILRDLMGYVKEHKIEIAMCKVTPEKLAAIVKLMADGAINNAAAKTVFDAVAATGADPKIIVKEQGLEQLGSSDELEAIVKAVVEQNPDVAAAYRSGKDKLIGFFVGNIMKQTGGKGNPHIIQELLKKYL
jgi:aspartyl-tRNA(Asn)/glutamyl-tRNA(Gln) amidotransferase subunit B